MEQLSSLLPGILGEHADIATNPLIAPVILAWAIGTATYLLRRVPSSIWGVVTRYCTTKITLTSQQRSFHDMMKWLEVRGYAQKFRRVQVRNGRHGFGEINKSAGGGFHWIIYPKTGPWWKRRLIYVFVERVEASATVEEKERLYFQTLGRSHRLIDELIVESEKTREDKSITKVLGFEEYWQESGSHPKRGMETIYIPRATKNFIVGRLDKFLGSEEYHSKHGIPWHFAIILYGPPGTGKTSLVKAIANHLNKGIGILQASKIQDIGRALRTLENDYIAVIEDIDTALSVKSRPGMEAPFGRVMGRKVPKKRLNPIGRKWPAPPTKIKSIPVPHVSSGPITVPSGKDMMPQSPSVEDAEENYKKISSFWQGPGLSDVLNSLDGIESAHGRIIVMTTNKIEVLDRAILRPGRVDVCVEIGYMCPETFEKMIQSFFDGFVLPDDYPLRGDVMAASVQESILRGYSTDEILEMYSEGK